MSQSRAKTRMTLAMKPFSRSSSPASTYSGDCVSRTASPASSCTTPKHDEPRSGSTDRQLPFPRRATVPCVSKSSLDAHCTAHQTRSSNDWRCNPISNGMRGRNTGALRRLHVHALPPRSKSEQRHVRSTVAPQPFITMSPPFSPKKHLVLPRPHESPTRIQNLDIAPGDVLFVKGNGCLEQIGTAGGFMGHVLVVLAPPHKAQLCSHAFKELVSTCPPESMNEVWSVRTLERTRNRDGLHVVDMLCRATSRNNRLVLIGEASLDAYKLSVVDNEVVEVWRSPDELRSQVHAGLITEVLMDMHQRNASWSMSQRGSANVDRHRLMKEIESCWLCNPICASVVITFWQRYLCKLADHLNSQKSDDSLCIDSADLILQFMPLKADRVLPDELHKVLRSCGWTPAASLLSWTCTS